MPGYISEEEVVELIGVAYPVFVRWHRGQTVVVEDGITYYPMADFRNWLIGEITTP